MGLLDNLIGSSIDDPRTAATLQLAQGLLSAPRAMQGLNSGLLGYQGAMAEAKQRKAVEDMRRMQLEALAFQQQQARKQAEQSDLDRTLTQRAFSPVAPIEANAASGVAGPRPKALGAVGQLPRFDPAQYIASGGSPDRAFALRQAMAKEQAKIKEFREVRGPDGSVSIVGFDEYGKPVQTGQTPFKASERVDLGGKVGFVDPVTNKVVGALGKTMTPGEAASNSLGWANFGVSRERLNLDRENAGGVTYQTDGTGQIVALPKRPTMAGPVTAIPVQGQGSQGKKDANEALAIIGEARKHLDTATGSGIGAATDAALGFFGKATDGAKATAQLQALAGSLVAKMPKMSGPQSDKDVLLYKQMAADIGNPWTPNEQRKAALDVVEGLQRKYAGLEPMNGQASPNGLKFLGFEGQ